MYERWPVATPIRSSSLAEDNDHIVELTRHGFKRSKMDGELAP